VIEIEAYVEAAPRSSYKNDTARHASP